MSNTEGVIEMTRVTGNVKFFNENKGYGFIARDDNRGDVFIHKNDLPDGIDRLNERQKVSFIVIRSDRKERGDKAVQLRIE
jgi:cold shock protein